LGDLLRFQIMNNDDPDVHPYQKFIGLYLVDCAKRRKKLRMKWVA
jgi:hypothetical protein